VGSGPTAGPLGETERGIEVWSQVWPELWGLAAGQDGDALARVCLILKFALLESSVVGGLGQPGVWANLWYGWNAN